MRVGKIIEIWRYPVKSMAGERMDETEVGELGIPGDRGWALFDENAREVRGAKNYPSLLQCRARYLEEPNGRIPPAEIRMPDGATFRSDDRVASGRLSEYLRAKVSLWPRRPADDHDHYRRQLPTDPVELERWMRALFGRLPDEPLPDLSIFPKELLEFTSPLGTYFDAFPLHFLTTSMLAELGRKNPGAAFDRRRFRPNLLIETDAQGYAEFEWCGKELRIGGLQAAIEMPVVRCSMTMQPQEELPKDPSVLRTIVRDADQNVGVYARTTGSGRVRVGDPVEIG